MGGRRWWILVALIVAVLPLAVDLALVTVALPSLAGELSTSRAHAAQAAAALPLSLGLALPFGALRRVGVRRRLLAGLAVAQIGIVAEVLASSLWQLAAARTIVGIGAAASLAAALPVVQAVFEPAEHVRAVAIWAGFTGLATAGAGLVGGLLADSFWWASVFVLEAAFVAVGLVLLAVLLPAVDEAPAGIGAGWSEPAGPVAVLGLVGAGVALSFRLQDSGHTAVRVGALLAVGATALSVAARLAGRLLRAASQRLVAIGGLALVASALAGLAGVTGASASAGLFALLAAGTALALAAGEGGRADPVVRMLAAGLGVVVLGTFEPRTGLLVAAALAVVVAAVLSLGRGGSRAARRR